MTSYLKRVVAKALRTYLRASGCAAPASEAQKDEFWRAWRSLLKHVAQEIERRHPGAVCAVRYCRGGPAVWGEPTLHANHVYVCVYPHSPGGILFRTSAHGKDYVGGRNQWLSVECVKEFDKFVDIISATYLKGEACAKNCVSV